MTDELANVVVRNQSRSGQLLKKARHSQGCPAAASNILVFRVEMSGVIIKNFDLSLDAM